ncbi:hypothetical protein F53441_11208 [Fusarium austroafricanum]|uniref:Rhodopsin domain-containing protein n=1 Tax=Fusarium austroafricanum TaxID=2364996 RepID=A0A8H4NQR0_9HYPO|nr:hypothetical protein F53441_11208 [Fusarium austroafricanum]
MRVISKIIGYVPYGHDDTLMLISFPMVVAFNVLAQIPLGAFTFPFIQRRPLHLFWTGWREKDPRGVILPVNTLTISHSTVNLALDVWMIYLPMTQLWGIGLKIKKKLGIIAMFSVGIFLTMVTTIRIPNVVTFSTSWNITGKNPLFFELGNPGF